MWTHPATQKNVRLCKEYGYRFLGPVKGPLASGDSGWSTSGVGVPEEPPPGVIDLDNDAFLHLRDGVVRATV